MPRASKRKAAPLRSPSVTSAADNRAGKAKSKEIERIDNLFVLYANNSLGMIDPEGIEALCSDMKVQHTDVRILMLAWKMNAQKQGYFTQDANWAASKIDKDLPEDIVLLLDEIQSHKNEEWRTGLKALHADNLNKLKKALPELEKEVGTPANFEDFYSFAFRYCLTEEKQKSVDIESICELLDLVLGSQFRAEVDSLIEYLKIQSDYKVINWDQWMNFLRFFKEISFPDFENYDATQAWPLILDNFVDWMKEKHRGSP